MRRFAWIALAAAACGSGKVDVVLVRPQASEAQLEAAATVVLTAERRGADDVVLTATVRDGHVDFGDLPVDDYDSMSVDLLGPTGAVVGYGRAADPVAVAADQDATVRIPIRRPRVYIAGPAPGRTIEAPLDGTTAKLVRLDRGGAAIDVDAIDLPASTGVVAAAGADMYVSSAGKIFRLDSSADTFEPQPMVDVGSDILDLAGSPDGKYLIAGSAMGLHVIDLAARQSHTIATGGQADAVATAIAPDGTVQALALVGAVRTTGGCPGASKLVVAPLAGGETATGTIDLGGGVADIAAARGKPFAVAAVFCRDQVAVVDLAQQKVSGVVAGVTAPTVVAASDTQAWAVGTVPGVVSFAGTSSEGVDRGAYHQLAVVDLTVNPPVGHVMDLPEIVQTIMPTDPGTSLAQSARAKRAVASSLSLSARGDVLTLSSNAVSRVSDVVLVDVFNTIIGYIFPPMSIHTSYQYGISTQTGALEHVIATRCVVCARDDGPPSLDYGDTCGNLQQDWQFPAWACQLPAGVTAVTGVNFEAGDSAALYGQP